MSILRRHPSDRGQSLVEFSFLLPMFVVLLLGMLEFGLVFVHDQSISYATRAGARIGSSLTNGQNGQNGTPGNVTCQTIDNQVIAAIQRALTNQGSLADYNHVTLIRIFDADVNGNPIGGAINTWTLGTGPVVGGVALKFHQVTNGWGNACTRNNGVNPDSIGVSINYNYQMITPLGSMLSWVGANTLSIYDQTVMVLNP